MPLFGARIGGLQEGGWNWQFIPPLLLGWIAGLFIAAISALWLSNSRYRDIRVIGILFAAPLLTAVIASCSYFIILSPQRATNAESRALAEKVEKDPGYISVLIEKSRTSDLSDSERSSIKNAFWKNASIPKKDIQHLLQYFSDDKDAIVVLISHQEVSADQLREVYNRYHGSYYQRALISSTLLKTPLTPPDIVEDIKQRMKAHRETSKKTDSTKANFNEAEQGAAANP